MRLLLFSFLAALTLPALAQNVNEITLENFRPVSIYKIPVTQITKAKYPVIDMHSHNYAKTDADVDAWVKMMDQLGISKTLILSYTTGAAFDSLIEKYSRYKDRFEVWCGFDYTGYEQPGWQAHAVAELERCYKKGARGVGELGDKGMGEFYSRPERRAGMHIDDPRMKPLIQKCGELKMPINIHVAEDEWMYRTPDSTNDGLMNAAKWHVDMSDPKKYGHDELVKSLENAVRDNPNTIFIAAHLANNCSNLAVLAKLFDTYKNFYADFAARFGELAPIPRYVKAFMEKYGDRLVYGTDMGIDDHMYRTTFRILETADEHFYEQDQFGYHWPLYGFNLNDATLKKVYSGTAQKILAHR